MRKEVDLKDYWPRSLLSRGLEIARVGYSGAWAHPYWTMFNPRQLLVHAQLLKAIGEVGNYDWQVREYVLGAYQQYLRNQNMFCFWDSGYDKLVPHLSNNNYHPKALPVENCVFATVGRGNWASCIEGIIEGRDWALRPWEAVQCRRA